MLFLEEVIRILPPTVSEFFILQKESSYDFLYTDRQRKEGKHGKTIACSMKEPFADKAYHTIIDTTGPRDFIKNMTFDTLRVGTALLMVPADGNFTIAIAKDSRKAGEFKGQVRQQSRSINLLGVRQICIVAKKKRRTLQTRTGKIRRVFDRSGEHLIKIGWKDVFARIRT